ncbi:MAG: hypothetical protein LUD79_04450 [Oscillospiraceae bacterium]|nr:hypothetical protein [Oscillospiraceae bacterium]
MEHRKMIRTAQVLDKIARVCCIVLYVVSAVMVVCGLVGAVAVGLGMNVSFLDSPEVNLGSLSLTLTEDMISAPFTYRMTLCIGALVVGIYCFVISRIGFRAIRSILAPMTAGRPFEAGCSRALKVLARLVLVGGILPQVGGLCFNAIQSSCIDLSSLFASDAGTGVTFHYVFEVNFIFCAVILYLMSYVSRYGEALQQESDETL